jgi:AGCS family alanine or glycine:cation symporter
MELLAFFKSINSMFALPSTILFFGTGIILTLKTGFIQIRAFPRFIRLITRGVAQEKQRGTINSFHALFTAMATTIGMGNIVGPSIAIVAGGPGALFWLLVYIFFGSVTKFTEVTFALTTRVKMADGYVVGGPMEYLKQVSPALASWYTSVMIFLFAGWSAAQANTLAQVFAKEAVPCWVIGLALAAVVLLVLRGGAQRVGATASKLVPLMFVLYITFALIILCKDLHALKAAIKLVVYSIFSPAAAVGGFVGATVFTAMRAGIFKAIFITEAGVGTSSIAHAVADTKRATDQGVLALYSMMSDAFLCTVSGLLVLVTGVWMTSEFKSTLVYDAFKLHAPGFGSFVLLASITLFVVTTVIGNSFNGMQNFASCLPHKGIKWYLAFTMLAIFLGSLMRVALVWEMMDTFLVLIAVPNLIGLLILAFRQPDVLRD